MLRIIEKKQQVKIEGTNDVYFNCVVCEIDKPDEQKEEVLHESEIALLEMLEKFQKSLKIHTPMMNEIWSKIEGYGDFNYSAGQDNAM